MLTGRIYIAGCEGMLREAIYRYFRAEYELKWPDIDVSEDWLSYLDFRDFVEYKNDGCDFHPDFLLHLIRFQLRMQFI